MQMWIELEKRLRAGKTINEVDERLIMKGKLYWQNVLTRLIAITKFLAAHNMAFRGSVDELNVPHNGNFLGLVQLLSEFDPVLQEHVKRTLSGQVHDHYLGKIIQNEIISMLADETRKEI